MAPKLLVFEVVVWFVAVVLILGVGVAVGLGVAVGVGVGAGGGWTVTCVVAWEVMYPSLVAVAVMVTVVSFVKLGAV